MFQEALRKSDTTFLNQLLILFHKCGFKFYRSPLEHYPTGSYNSCYSTLIKTKFIDYECLHMRSGRWRRFERARSDLDSFITTYTIIRRKRHYSKYLAWDQVEAVRREAGALRLLADELSSHLARLLSPEPLYKTSAAAVGNGLQPTGNGFHPSGGRGSPPSTGHEALGGPRVPPTPSTPFKTFVSFEPITLDPEP